MASNNTASIAQARKLVEQLKMEANIDRIKVSRCFLGSCVGSAFGADGGVLCGCAGFKSGGGPDVVL